MRKIECARAVGSSSHVLRQPLKTDYYLCKISLLMLGCNLLLSLCKFPRSTNRGSKNETYTRPLPKYKNAAGGILNKKLHRMDWALIGACMEKIESALLDYRVHWNDTNLRYCKKMVQQSQLMWAFKIHLDWSSLLQLFWTLFPVVKGLYFYISIPHNF